MIASVWGRLGVRAALIYLVMRVVSGLLLAMAADDQVWFPGVTGPSEDDIDLALSWDGQWYQRIADEGYPSDLPIGADGRVQQNPWAFYPLFPLVARWVGAVTSLDFATVAPPLALLAGMGAAVLMARLFVETLPSGSEWPALGAVAVWAAVPVSPVLQMAYTESFSMLLLVATLLLLVRERWWAAGFCALALGVTRPIALPLILVLLVAIWLRWRERRDRPLSIDERVAMGGALGLTLASGGLWTAVAWAGTGRRDAYPETMTAWRGEASINVIEPWLRTIDWAWTYHDKVFVLPALGMVVPLALCLVLLVPRVAPWIDLRLRVWSAAYSLYLLAVVDGHTSIFRYLLPLFPIALALVGTRWWSLRTAFWVGVGVLGQVGWIWWLVVFTPPSDYPP